MESTMSSIHTSLQPSHLTLSNNDDYYKKKKTKRKKEPKIIMTANMSGTRYDVVKQIVAEQGFQLAKDDDFRHCYLIWSDAFIPSERISMLKPFQRVNHFPGMGEISRKDCLAKNMNRMAKHKEDEYDFVPRTWVLPQDYASFISSVRESKRQEREVTYIMKPWNGAMGNGIRLYRNGEAVSSNENCIMQEYIDKPFLIDGYKCDLRIYVLVTSCDPLRVFLYKEGLVRLGTEPYIAPSEKNSESLYIHLTNYSINKHNENYERSDDERTGSKRSFSFFNEYLKSNNHEVGTIWRNITHVLLKTIILVSPHIFHAYRACRPGKTAANDSVCFEILGFDVLLDHKLRPWLLEVNRSPSFGTDQELDLRVKQGLLRDTFRLLHIKPSDKRRNLIALRNESQRRLFRTSWGVIERDGRSENVKRQRDIVKKKEELREALIRLRYDAKRNEFEAQNCGNFTRIFPVDDIFRHQKYADLIVESFTLFNKRRGTGLQKEIQYTYLNKLHEDDIMEMMAECESQEKKLSQSMQLRAGRLSGIYNSTGTISLSYMDLTSSSKSDRSSDSDVSDENSSVLNDNCHHSQQQQPPPQQQNSGTSRKQSLSAVSERNSKPPSVSRSLPSSKTPSAVNSPAHQTRQPSQTPLPSKSGISVDSARLSIVTSPLAKATPEDIQTSVVVFRHLKTLQIKFPGKSTEEAEQILQKMRGTWSIVCEQVASYWLGRLDADKRRRVIDIVRSNVRAVLARVYTQREINQMRLYHIFNRLCQGLLQTQGQGLWDTFSDVKAWEAHFQASEHLQDIEVKCCQRVVTLCQDCLLVVYRYAIEAQTFFNNSGRRSDSPSLPSIQDDKYSLSPYIPNVLLTVSRTSSTQSTFNSRDLLSHSGHNAQKFSTDHVTSAHIALLRRSVVSNSTQSLLKRGESPLIFNKSSSINNSHSSESNSLKGNSTDRSIKNRALPNTQRRFQKSSVEPVIKGGTSLVPRTVFRKPTAV